jgi:hypothetical protein
MRRFLALLPVLAVGIIASALLFTWVANDDVQGQTPTASPSPGGFGYHPVPPARVLDTRSGPGPVGPVGPGATIWDTAHAIVQSRGASIIKACEPTCSPDDHTKAWIVEVRGTFVPPESNYGGAMVPDSIAPEATSPTAPIAGTWFSIIPFLGY